jgi:catechol 2,3-dioxygenase-like lactoylglutathione lyase family enzyme
MQLDHFAFEVSDLDRSLVFYTQVIGLPLLSRTVDEEHGEAFAFLDLGGATLELLQKLDQATPPALGRRLRATNSPHLALRVPDLEAALAALADHGLRPFEGPLFLPDVARWAYIEDPDGNVLEYVQWLTPPR